MNSNAYPFQERFIPGSQIPSFQNFSKTCDTLWGVIDPSVLFPCDVDGRLKGSVSRLNASGSVKTLAKDANLANSREDDIGKVGSLKCHFSTIMMISNSMHYYVNIVSKYAYQGSHVFFLVFILYQTLYCLSQMLSEQELLLDSEPRIRARFYVIRIGMYIYRCDVSYESMRFINKKIFHCFNLFRHE